MTSQPENAVPDPSPVERRSLAIGLVNPDRSYREFVGRLLSAAGHRVVEARDRQELSLVLASHRLDCIVIDHDLGAEMGLAAFVRLQETVDPMPPVVMLTGADDERLAIAAFRQGISDLVPKRGMQAADLLDAIADAVAKAVLADQHKAELNRSRRLATVDGATGLLSRREVERRLAALGASAKARNGTYAVLVATVDPIQALTDRLGMAVGDRALALAASRLQKSMRPNDICGRYGDATFLYAVDEDPTPDMLDDFGRRMVAALSFDFHADGSVDAIAPRIGVAKFPRDGDSPDSLVAFAVRKSKAAGEPVAPVSKPVVAPEPPPVAVAVAVAAPAPAAVPVEPETIAAPVAPPEPARSPDGASWANRRRSQRVRVLKRGNIAPGDGRPPVDCMIRDISDGGARLLVSTEEPLPATFRLLIADMGEWRKVERRWVNGADIGVEFVP